MGKMSPDEVNVGLFDEVKRLRDEHEELKSNHDYAVNTIESMLVTTASKLRELEQNGSGHIYLAETQNERLKLSAKREVLVEVLTLIRSPKTRSEELTEEEKPVGYGLTKEDLAKMSMEEINELMDKAIQKGHLQFLREL